MARKSGIWWHESRQCWYTSHGGKNQRLDPNKKKAEHLWAKIAGKATAKGDDLMVKQVLDQYLDWSEANHAETTQKRVRASILSFAESLPPGLIIANLEPSHLTSWLDKRYPKKITKEAIKDAAEREAKAAAKAAARGPLGKAKETLSHAEAEHKGAGTDAKKHAEAVREARTAQGYAEEARLIAERF